MQWQYPRSKLSSGFAIGLWYKNNYQATSYRLLNITHWIKKMLKCDHCTEQNTQITSCQKRAGLFKWCWNKVLVTRIYRDELVSSINPVMHILHKHIYLSSCESSTEAWVSKKLYRLKEKSSWAKSVKFHCVLGKHKFSEIYELVPL